MIYIDCSEVVRHPHLHTGIQRVVRNIAGRLAKDMDCQMVAFLGFGFIAVHELPIVCEGEVLRKGKGFWTLIKNTRDLLIKNNSLRLIYCAFFLPFFGWFRRQIQYLYFVYGGVLGRYERIDIQKGDVLILLDSNWHSDTFLDIIKLEKKGVLIFTVIYDLIPVDFPEYCADHLCVVFEKWLKNIVNTSSAFITISIDAKESLQRYLCSTDACDIPTEYFYLGADLDGNPHTKKGEIRQKILDLCGAKLILAVGTIEPRKRYDLIVDGFRRSGLADEGYILVCIGRIGWKVDQFVSAIKSADDYERSIFLLQDISDSELAYFYDACELLVFASDVEGFGLPLVEARMKGKRVLASDIPVFREIADHGVSFFEAGNPLSLAEKLPATLAMPNSPGVMEWMTWDEASQQFLSKIKNMVSLLNQKESQ